MKKYKKESDFQADLIKEIENRFPGCIVLKNDATYTQGIPDLSIFYKNHWAFLECKIRESAKKQANQDYYIEKANTYSFGSFIYPENKEAVLNELEQAFRN